LHTYLHINKAISHKSADRCAVILEFNVARTIGVDKCGQRDSEESGEHWAVRHTALLVLISSVASAAAAAAAAFGRNLSCARRPCRNLITSGAPAGQCRVDSYIAPATAAIARPGCGDSERMEDSPPVGAERHKRAGISLIDMEAQHRARSWSRAVGQTSNKHSLKDADRDMIRCAHHIVVARSLAALHRTTANLS